MDPKVSSQQKYFTGGTHDDPMPYRCIDSSSITHPPCATHHRYVVTFDGARGLSNTNALILSCAGSAADCGCTDIIGGIARPEGSRIGCGSAIFGEERASTSAEFFESQCRVQAKIDLKTIRKGDETAVNGGGILTFSDGGQYFLPSVVEADVGVKAGAEVVCSAWTAEITGVVNVSSSGVLWFAGGGIAFRQLPLKLRILWAHATANALSIFREKS